MQDKRIVLDKWEINKGKVGQHGWMYLMQCPTCRKIFELYGFQYNRNITYCSHKCWGKTIKHKKFSKQHRTKISKKLKGKSKSQKHKKQLSLVHKGKHQTKETRQKISMSLQNISNVQWKGFITPLTTLIRGSVESIRWRNTVFKRDNYTCQECGDNKGGNLEAHHNIKPFSIVFQEFLNIYSQFSPIEDKETLLRLATTYEPFWEINNGITLCEECHKLKLFIKSDKVN
jgi:5-methylcytosine-specific restriction endonuclease McrA